jgi:hypothetical protein
VSNPYRDRLLGVGVISRRTGDRVKEWRTDDGQRHKATTDELNNTVTQHARPNHTEDRQDVTIRPEPVRVHIEELRRGAK